MLNTVFVQIASYRDPQLIPTLNSLIDNAVEPSSLHIGICWQHGPEETLNIFFDAGFQLAKVGQYQGFSVYSATYKAASFKIISVEHLASQGACWARHSIQQLYADERYTLQLDSHHRFVSGWDRLCIDLLEGLRAASPKPLLTGYIPSFDPDNDPAGRATVPWKMGFDQFIPEGAIFFMPEAIDSYEALPGPIRARFYSAHFAFADGSFAVEVQHNPEYFFHGEEISIGVRAFTHGYDLYHPHVLIAWHEYTRRNRTKVWDDHTTEKRAAGILSADWLERNAKCHKLNRQLFGMDGEVRRDFGKYGFGKARSLEEYEEYAGISFSNRTAKRDWTGAPPRCIQICVSKDELLETDYSFCYVGAHDSEGEICRKDLSGEELYEKLKGGWLHHKLIFASERVPTHYILWPYSKTNGWMLKIEREIALNHSHK